MRENPQQLAAQLRAHEERESAQADAYWARANAGVDACIRRHRDLWESAIRDGRVSRFPPQD